MRTHKRSLTHFNITSMDAGVLYPIGFQEVIPGDTFQAASSALVRLQPMNAPTMHPIHARIMHFFIPNRLLMEEKTWESFITDLNSEVVLPTVLPSTDAEGLTIENYLGASAAVSNTNPISALPRRAYNLVWNEYFRDQDLQEPAALSLAQGPDTTSNGLLLRAAWKKDQLTTARPFAAKGPAAIIPVMSTGNSETNKLPVKHGAATNANISIYSDSQAAYKHPSTSGAYLNNSTGSTGSATDAMYADPTAYLELLGILPNDIRIGLATQKWEEISARYGSRYTEYLRARFGVLAQDSRLQRPEYLAGGETTIQMSEVLQTSNPGDVTDLDDAVAALKGHGIGSVKSNAFRRFFPEHGIMMSFMVIRPIPIYVDAPSRFFFKRTPFDFYTKEFAHIGSASINKGEVRLDATPATESWAFQDQYYDYRSRKNYVSGKMRNTFNYWSEFRQFASTPVLNAQFIECTPSDRIFAAPVDQNYVVMVHNKCVVRGQVAPVGSTSNL